MLRAKVNKAIMEQTEWDEPPSDLVQSIIIRDCNPLFRDDYMIRGGDFIRIIPISQAVHVHLFGMVNGTYPMEIINTHILEDAVIIHTDTQQFIIDCLSTSYDAGHREWNLGRIGRDFIIEILRDRHLTTQIQNFRFSDIPPKIYQPKTFAKSAYDALHRKDREVYLTAFNQGIVPKIYNYMVPRNGSGIKRIKKTKTKNKNKKTKKINLER